MRRNIVVAFNTIFLLIYYSFTTLCTTIDHEQICQPHETYKTIAHSARDRSEFCAAATSCFERLKGQLDLRFDSNKQQTVIIMYEMTRIWFWQ